MKGNILTGLAVAAMVGLFSFALIGGGDSSEFDSITAQSASPDNTAHQGLAPAISGQSFDGEPINLASYRGQKNVVLDFWASWCPNCTRNMPKLQELYSKYQDDVEVIAVHLSTSESVDVGAEHVASRGYTFKTLIDPDGSIAQAMGVVNTNYHVIINKDGQIVNSFASDISERHFEQLLAEN